MVVGAVRNGISLPYFRRLCRFVYYLLYRTVNHAGLISNVEAFNREQSPLRLPYDLISNRELIRYMHFEAPNSKFQLNVRSGRAR